MRNYKMANKSSGELINYTLRPKKQIERKIIINGLKEIFNILSLSQKLSNYRYVGMGSFYYYDFIMFHKFLHIKKMTSLDNYWTKKRFEFNRPYDFIDFVPKSTLKFLETFEMKDSLIVWFDYDYGLFKRVGKIVDTEILQEIQLLQDKLKLDDVFLVTINVKYPGNSKPKREEINWMFEKFKLFLPKEIKTSEDIIEKNYVYVIQKILINCLTENQKFRNIKFKKIMSFLYSDGVPMYTFVAMAYKKEESLTTLKIPYINTEEDEITIIDVPNLTAKEKIYLDSQINAFTKKVSKLNLSENRLKKIILEDFEINFQDLSNYIDYYKYYPQYFETLL